MLARTVSLLKHRNSTRNGRRALVHTPVKAVYTWPTVNRSVLANNRQKPFNGPPVAHPPSSFSMIYYCLTLLVGFLVLFKSADQLVIGAVATARHYKISPVLIGLTVVAFGTSAPEIFVSAVSSLEKTPQLAVGNAIGSNITNLGMVLGVTALFVPLKFKPEILQKDMPILLFVTICAGVTLIDLHLGLWDGVLLLTVLGFFLYRLAADYKASSNTDTSIESGDLEAAPALPKNSAIALFIGSLIFLLLSCELLVWSAVNIAQLLDVSELIIGLTIIAVGTSLPELVVSITSALREQAELAIGNIVGSNIFNILAVLSLPCVIAPTELSSDVLWRDYSVMLILTLLLIMLAFRTKAQASTNKANGVIFVSIWLGYLFFLYLTSSSG